MDDARQNRPEPDSEPSSDCQQCGKPLKLVTELPMFGIAPDLRLFQCTGCGYVDWIPAGAGA